MMLCNIWRTPHPLTWTDHHLRWNITDFAGISEVRIPAEKVWKPDIILYNNANSDYQASMISTNVIVNNLGKVLFLQHGIFRSTCTIDVEYFPFDVQTCQLKFASWTYDEKQVKLNMLSPKGDLSGYHENGEFSLEKFHSTTNLLKYSCCQHPYPDITFTIKLRRRPMFYVFNLILPCALINGIAMFVFCVPSNSGEKVTLSISTLLSLTVFLMVVRETLPPTEKTPLICIYYGVTITMVTMATALAVVTLNIHYRGGSNGSEVPSFLKKLILGYMSKFVFVNVTTSSNYPDVKTFKEINQREIAGKIFQCLIKSPNHIFVYSQKKEICQACSIFGAEPIPEIHLTSKLMIKYAKTVNSQEHLLCTPIDSRKLIRSRPPSSNLDFRKVRGKIDYRRKDTAGRRTFNLTYSKSMQIIAPIPRIEDCSTMTRGATIDDDMFEKVELDHLEQYKFSPRSRRHHFKPNMTPCPQHDTSLITDPATLGPGSNSGLNVLSIDRCSTGRLSSSQNDDFENNFLRVLTKVYKTIEKNEMRVADHERQDSIRTEWQYVALICDRFLLLIFLFTAAVSTILILIVSPRQ
ncbi:Neuronal acetylcholine receptor subunit alpha-9-II [Nymphon striatum]|nr:Neuronal acetylcholine receptor subunit alpha-9-II [Nymphon striatum]